jgi:hypothetical protein
VSLNYTLQISHIKFYLHSRTFFFTAELPTLISLSWFLNTLSKVKAKSKLLYDWRFLPPISCLGVKPLETHNWRLFFQLKACGHSPYVTSSLTRRWFRLLWIGLTFRQVCVSHIYHVNWNFFLLHYTQVLCQFRLCKAEHTYLTYLTLQRQISHLNGRKLDHRQV